MGICRLLKGKIPAVCVQLWASALLKGKIPAVCVQLWASALLKGKIPAVCVVDYGHLYYLRVR